LAAGQGSNNKHTTNKTEEKRMREQSKILIACSTLAWVLACVPGSAAPPKYEQKLPYDVIDPTVVGPPIIICNPETTVVKEHSEAEFKVDADGPDPFVFPVLSYRWQRRGPGLTNFLDIDGATKSSYVIAHASTNDVAYYRVLVSSSTNGTATSLPAQLLVYTHHSPFTVYGAPVVYSGGGGDCPGAYAGYVNYKHSVADPAGYLPDHGNGNATHSVTDKTRSDTKVLVVGTNDTWCATTTVPNTHAGHPSPEDSKWKFSIYFPNNVPTSSYPITLDGFIP
jgi:hypothetical protein